MTVRTRDVIATGAVGVRSKRGRALLTSLGIAIGIAAMVAVVGISASSRTDLLDELDRLGTNLLQVQASNNMFGEETKLPTKSASMIRRVAPVQSAAATRTVKATVRRSDKIPSEVTGGLSVIATEPQLLNTLGATMHAGSFLSDATARYPTVVLGSEAASRLGITHADGRTAVYINGYWFTVVGILDPVPLAPDIDRSVLIGYPVAQRLFGIDDAPSTVRVRTDPNEVSSVQSVLAATANPEHPSDVSVSRPSDALAAKAQADESLTALLLGLGAVALVVGGVGIANVMVIAVLERRTEIGLRRALGATRRHIRAQFLIEAVLLAAAGGAAGVIAGSAITFGYAHSRGWRFDVPITALLGGVGASLVLGAFAGLY
ncbi:MAG: putative transport system permease protein, partial [Acidimicrobiaceae bacterium]